MPQCSFKKCKNHSSRTLKKDGVSYFRFPRDPVRYEQWIYVLARQRSQESFKPSHGSVICSKHFLERDIYVTSKGYIRLHKTAVPLIGNQYENEDLDAENAPGTSSLYLNQGSSPNRHEIKVFCPKCNSEVSHTAQGIQEDQTKLIIARVYHYLEQEFQELKNIYESLDLTSLSRIHQRTAFATGVNESTVFEILKEEEERNAVKQEELLESQRQARNRSRQDDSVQENDSDDDLADAGEQTGTQEESEIETLVVKVEPPEYYEEPEIILQPFNVKSEPSEQEKMEEGDPISLDIKTEHQDEEVDNTNETLGSNEPDCTKRKGKKRQRKNDVTTQQQSRGVTLAVEPSSSGTHTEAPDEEEPEILLEQVNVKSEPSEQEKITYETLGFNEPSTKRKGKKRQRKNDVKTQQQSRGDTSTAEPSSSGTHTEAPDENSFFGEREVKNEKLEIHEEGFS